MTGRLKSLKHKTELRCGVTTGACAAAAALAAALFVFRGETYDRVTVYNPAGTPIEVPVKSVKPLPGGSRAVVVKDGGDDPDVTHGLDIVVDVFPTAGGICLKGGPGVGRVTRPGLQIPVGRPAINPVPRRMILDTLAKVLPVGAGMDVVISVPGGEEVALRTLNPRLGITGGISILGTTGIVRPMSEEAFKDSLAPLVKMAAVLGHSRLVLTPGRMGQRMAEEYGFPAETVVEMSNFVGFMLNCCSRNGISEVVLWGHIGKLVKVAAGIFHTHSKVADGRREVIAAYAALQGAGRDIIQEIMHANTLEGLVDYLADKELGFLFNLLAERVSFKAMEYVKGSLKVGTVMLAMDGRILGLDQGARDIGRKMGCIKLP